MKYTPETAIEAIRSLVGDFLEAPEGSDPGTTAMFILGQILAVLDQTP